MRFKWQAPGVYPPFFHPASNRRPAFICLGGATTPTIIIRGPFFLINFHLLFEEIGLANQPLAVCFIFTVEIAVSIFSSDAWQEGDCAFERFLWGFSVRSHLPCGYLDYFYGWEFFLKMKTMNENLITWFNVILHVHIRVQFEVKVVRSSIS